MLPPAPFRGKSLCSCEGLTSDELLEPFAEVSKHGNSLAPALSRTSAALPAVARSLSMAALTFVAGGCRDTVPETRQVAQGRRPDTGPVGNLSRSHLVSVFRR